MCSDHGAHITQRSELRSFLRLDIRRSLSVAHVLLDGLTHAYVSAPVLLKNIVLLRGIFTEIVKLWFRGANEVIVPIDERMKIAPAEMKTRIETLRVDLALGSAFEKREQRLPRAMTRRWWRCSRPIE